MLSLFVVPGCADLGYWPVSAGFQEWQTSLETYTHYQASSFQLIYSIHGLLLIVRCEEAAVWNQPSNHVAKPAKADKYLRFSIVSPLHTVFVRECSTVSWPHCKSGVGPPAKRGASSQHLGLHLKQAQRFDLAF